MKRGQGGKVSPSVPFAMMVLALVAMLVSAGTTLALRREGGANAEVAVLSFAAVGLTAALALWASRVVVQGAYRDAEQQIELWQLRSELAAAQAARQQRHDLLNQLSVVSALIQMGANARALDYLRRAVQANERACCPERDRSSLPDIGLLLGMLAQKFARADREGVRFQLEVDCRQGNLCVPDHVMVRVLGNLVDNALDAASEASGEGGQVKVSVHVTAGSCLARVWNNGPPIPPEIRKRMFAPGRTTKSGDHEGLGLYLVQQLVRESQGRLRFESDAEQGTFFEVEFVAGSSEGCPEGSPADHSPAGWHGRELSLPPPARVAGPSTDPGDRSPSLAGTVQVPVQPEGIRRAAGRGEECSADQQPEGDRAGEGEGRPRGQRCENIEAAGHTVSSPPHLLAREGPGGPDPDQVVETYLAQGVAEVTKETG